MMTATEELLLLGMQKKDEEILILKREINKYKTALKIGAVDKLATMCNISGGNWDYLFSPDDFANDWLKRAEEELGTKSIKEKI